MVQALKPGDFENQKPSNELVDKFVGLVNQAILSGLNCVHLSEDLRCLSLLRVVQKQLEEAGWNVNRGRFQLDMMYPEEFKFYFWPK